MPSPGNLLPSERLGLGLPTPSKKAEIDAVLSLNAEADKFHRHWFAEYQRACCRITTIQVQVAVRSYIARKANRVPWRNRERWLSDGPLNQPLHFVVIVAKKFPAIAVAVESLFCHVAKELNIPVVALSQLNRAVENRPDRRPLLADLRESGAIEQDADVVLFVHRPETYGITEIKDDELGTVSSEGMSEIIIGKQRNGPTGIVRLAFVKEYAGFEKLASPNMAAYLPPPPESVEEELPPF